MTECPVCGQPVEIKYAGVRGDEKYVGSHTVGGRVCETSWEPPGVLFASANEESSPSPTQGALPLE